ncbi:MAG: DUF4148 domain-containing protein [Rubrivivax sp.]|nr:DUF4148 domain-containing protein [Rubrivivax sp.]
MNAITRNTALLAVAAATFAVVGTPARAQEATYELAQPIVVAKSRADVRAEVLQARRAGTLPATEADFQRQDPFVAGKSRAEVAAEVRADRGASRALVGEPHDFAVAAPAPRQPQARVLASVAR